MPISKTTLLELEHTDGTIRARAVQALLAAHAREGLREVDDLAQAVAALEKRSDWSLVLVVTDAVLRLDLSDERFVEWLLRKAWCLFWSNRPTEAWDILMNVRDLVERYPRPEFRLRLFLVSGYVMDVRGAHENAQGWYAKALAVADENAKPAVLLEMATSLSKQGALTEALARFDEALGLLREGDPAHERLRVHLLSRSAVALENLGDLLEALRRHDLAVAAAMNQDPQLAFETRSRRARTHLARRDFVKAEADLAAMEPYAERVRRGVLHLTHDWARVHRTRGNFPEALGQYRACVRLLPEAPEILSTYSDIWGEILDGLAECLRQTKSARVGQIETAQALLQALRARPDIYGGQSVTQGERLSRAVAATAEVRRLLLETDRETFVAAGFRFNLTAGTATRISSSDNVVPLDEGECLLLAVLALAPENSASVSMIRAGFKKKGVAAPSPEALRQMVMRLRKKLHLGPGELLQGKRGTKGGGYILVVERK